MTAMLEKAARAAFYAMPRDPDREGLDCDTWDEMWQDGVDPNSCFHVVARAVLMAVREPSDSLSAAAQSTEGWEAMIDALLLEGEQ